MARQIRAGLEPEPVSYVKKAPINALDQLWFRKPMRQHLKEFACVLGTIALAIAAIQAWKGRFDLTFALVLLTSVFVVLGYRFPAVLLPVWRGFMRVGEGIGMVVTLLILALAWLTVVIPLGILLRIIGKKVMSMDFRGGVAQQSYWEARDSKLDDFKLLERQF